jgi:1-acyl-sn-glycerol-3-phosphate acyltransferase
MVSSPETGHHRDGTAAGTNHPAATRGIREGRMIQALRRGAKWLLDWTTSLLFLLVFGLLCLFFDPVQRIGYAISRRAQEIAVGWLQVGISYALRICGTRYRIERSPQVKPHTAYLIVANHQSMFDIPILSWLMFTNYPKFVSKRELGKGIPSISYNLQVGGHALINRRDRNGALQAIRQLAATVRERGVSAVIYPEGTRAKDGTVGPFKPAGALELMRSAAEAPVVTVVMDGQWKIVRRGLRPVPFGTIVNVRICDPIERAADEDPGEVLARCEQTIRHTVAGWRGEPVEQTEPGEEPMSVSRR